MKVVSAFKRTSVDYKNEIISKKGYIFIKENRSSLSSVVRDHLNLNINYKIYKLANLLVKEFSHLNWFEADAFPNLYANMEVAEDQDQEGNEKV